MPTGIYKRKAKIRIICKICGKEFFVWPSTFKRDNTKYCSKKCSNVDWIKIMKSKHLIIWNKGIKTGIVPKSAFKKGVIPWNKGLKGVQPTSEETRKKRSEFNKGSKCHFWKGGVTKINDTLRKTLRYKLWRDKVFKRDDYTCCECGERGGRLEAHHIEPWSTNKKLRFVIRNGNTLCIKCHKYIHINEAMIKNAIKKSKTTSKG